MTSIGRGHPRLLFATLTVGHLSQGLAFTAAVAALPQMAQDFGSRGELVAQMTMALAALGLLVGSLCSGWILQRGGTRGTMLIAIAVFGIAGAGGLALRSPAPLLASRFVVGFASACMVTACLWGIAAEYTGHTRASALGIVNALGSLMALAGTLLGGLLARIGGWSLTFVQYPIFAALTLLLAYIGLGQARPAKRDAEQPSEPFFRRLFPFFLLTTLLFVVLFTGSIQLPFLLESDGVHDPGTRSLVMGMVTVVGTLTSFCYGPLQRRLGVGGTFLLGLVAVATALSFLGLGASVLPAAIGAALLGIFVGTAVPYAFHTVSERTDEYSRSYAVGITTAFCYLGAFLNPLVFSVLARRFGSRGALAAASVAMAVLALGMLPGLLRKRPLSSVQG